MNIKKTMVAVFLFLLLFCMLNTSTYAAEAKSIDINKKGNVSISFRYNSEVVSGGKLTIIKVADVTVLDGSFLFNLTDDFKSSGLSLNDVSDSLLALSLFSYSTDHNLSGKTMDISDMGNVTFSELDTGLYLFSQPTPAKGYKAITPFLVSVPLNSDGEYLYNIDASPKVQISKEYVEPSMPYSEKPKESKLPQTGQLNWPIPVLITSGLIFLIIGWILRFGLWRQNKVI